MNCMKTNGNIVGFHTDGMLQMMRVSVDVDDDKMDDDDDDDGHANDLGIITDGER